MNFRKGKVREEPEINLIPFIDVLLVILIFLMITTTYSKYSELQITLPTAEAEKMPERSLELNVSVSAHGEYAINNNRVAFTDPTQLAMEMKRAAPNIQEGRQPVVIISADGNAPHQRVINVLEAARIAGLERITFATQTQAGR